MATIEKGMSMWTIRSLLIAAAVAIALPAAGCKPDPVKPKVSEPQTSTSTAGFTASSSKN